MEIRNLGLNGEPPMEFLLLADPSRKLVEEYIKRGQCFVARLEDRIIGVYVLLPTRPQTIELVNVAVDEKYQGQGIGKQLVMHAIHQARLSGFKTIEVGTGNSGVGQLALYQNCKFRITCIDKDYITRKIFENGHRGNRHDTFIPRLVIFLREGMFLEIIIKPVAFVSNSRKNIEDDNWGSIISEIELIEELDESFFEGIGEFSHLEIIFHFDQAKDDRIQYGARHPRNDKELPKVGIFAQRGKNRPNKLGLTTVELIQHDGRKIIVMGLDAIDGTPIIDIKPVMKEFLPRKEIKQAKWSADLMKNYWRK